MAAATRSRLSRLHRPPSSARGRKTALPGFSRSGALNHDGPSQSQTLEKTEGCGAFAYGNCEGSTCLGTYVDELLSYTVGSTRYFTHANHLYSIAATTNAAGAVVERYAYDAYGTQTVTNAAGTVTLAESGVSQTRGFTGYILDQETGLYHARARMYSATLGNFTSRDRAGYVDGASLYRGYFVPSGLDPTGLYKSESSDEYCDPPKQRDLCGPDIDDVFRMMVMRVGARMLNNPLNELGAGVGAGLLFLKNNGDNMDFVPSNVAGCATGKCRGTYRLFGHCMSMWQVNNMVYGLAAALAGVSIGDAWLGANANNVMKGNGLEGDTQLNSYMFGYRMAALLKDVDKGLDKESFADYVKDRDIQDMLKKASEGDRFKDCDPCGQSAHKVGKDFSRMTWLWR